MRRSDFDRQHDDLRRDGRSPGGGRPCGGGRAMAWVGLCLALLLSLGVLQPVRGEDENVLFDLKDFRTIDQIPPGAKQGLSANWEREPDGGVRCELDGSVSGRRRWLIPINGDVRADCEVRFSVESANIVAMPRHANLRLLLRRRAAPTAATGGGGDGGAAGATLSDAEKAARDEAELQALAAAAEAGPETLEIPLYSSVGAQHQEISRKTFSTRNGDYRVEGFIVDLNLLESGTARLVIHNLRITYGGNLPDRASVDEVLATPPPRVAAIKRLASNRLAITVDGEPVAAYGYSPGRRVATDEGARMSRVAGLRLQRVMVNLGGPSRYFPRAVALWRTPEYLDFDVLDDSLRRGLPDDDSLAILDVLMTHPPAWWPGLDAPEPESIGSWVSDYDAPLRASRQEGLRLLLAHLRQGPFADRVIGVNLILGQGFNDAPPPGRERHPAYVQAFQQWLTAQYADDAALAKAWGRDDVTRANATPLPATEWAGGAVFQIRHPGMSRRAWDSQRFYNESWAMSLLDFCGMVKTLTAGRYLVGLPGGPMLALNDLWANGFSQAPWAWRLILQSPHVDLLSIPADTTDRSPAVGNAGGTLVLAADARAHGKLLFLDCTLDSLPGYTLPITPDSVLANELQVHRRTFAAALRADAGIWLGQPADTRLNDRNWVQEIAAEVRIQTRARSLTYDTAADVAIVVDPDLAAYLAPDAEQPPTTSGDIDLALRRDQPADRPGDHASRAWFLAQMVRQSWPRAGFSYDVMSLDACDPAAYRAVIYFNTLHFEADDLQRLATARGGKRALVWTWADGIASDDTLSPATMNRESGFDLGLTSRASRFDIASAPALIDYLEQPRITGYLGWVESKLDRARGIALNFGPRFHVQNPDAQVLGVHRGAEQAAMAVLPHDDWTAWYSASPYLNPEVLHGIAAAAGAHCYLASGDWSQIDRRFITIHTKNDGVRTITLPSAEPLYEVFLDTELPAQSVQRIKMAGAVTYMFFRGTRAEWQQAGTAGQ